MFLAELAAEFHDAGGSEKGSDCDSEALISSQAKVTLVKSLDSIQWIAKGRQLRSRSFRSRSIRSRLRLGQINGACGFMKVGRQK